MTTATHDPEAKAFAEHLQTDDAWLAQLDSLEERPPLEEFVTLHDPAKLEAVGLARRALVAARRTFLATVTDDSLTKAQVEAKVKPKVKAEQKALDEAIAAEQNAQVTFQFRALPPHLYEALKGEHPPTEAQELQNMDRNPETYVPALWAACSVKPLSFDRAARLMTKLNTGDAAALAECARRVNETATASLGKGSRPTADSEGS